MAGVGWDSLAAIAAYHGAQATWPPLLTPSSSSSIPQLPPPKLNNAQQNIFQAARICRWELKGIPIYVTNKDLYFALLYVTNIWRLLCALWQGGGGTRQHHTAHSILHTFTYSTLIWSQKEKISPYAINSFGFGCSLRSFVDYLKDKIDETAEIGYLFRRTSKSTAALFKLPSIHPLGQRKRYQTADLNRGKIKMTITRMLIMFYTSNILDFASISLIVGILGINFFEFYWLAVFLSFVIWLQLQARVKTSPVWKTGAQKVACMASFWPICNSNHRIKSGLLIMLSSDPSQTPITYLPSSSSSSFSAAFIYLWKFAWPYKFYFSPEVSLSTPPLPHLLLLNVVVLDCK